MSILVTGASGFLGRHVVERLVKDGEQICVIVRPSSDVSRLKEMPLKIYYEDLADPKNLDLALSGVKMVINCAAAVVDWAPDEVYYGGTVLAAKNLIEAATKSDSLERFVHISSRDVYGYPEQPCDEMHSMRDIGLPYNSSKVAAEQIVWGAYDKYKIPITVLRPGPIFGPYAKAFVIEICKVIRQGMMLFIDGGRHIAGISFVDNIVDAVLQASHSSNTIGQAYNLNDNNDITWREYILALARGLNHPPPKLNLSGDLAMQISRVLEFTYRSLGIWKRPLLTQHVVRLMCLDGSFPTDKAKKDFLVQPSVEFGEAMDRTLKWLNKTANTVT